ncbi:MAG: hypothetical protein EBR27_09350, partial [Betaproteobacteria bacterium]|nr:hypothetical protein [Betaproteobacteria bacterium]
MIPRFAKKHKCFGMPEIPRPPPQEDTDSDTSESDIEAIAAPTDYKTMVAQQAKEIARLQAALDAKTSKRRVKKRIVEVLASDSETSEEEVTVVRR